MKHIIRLILVFILIWHSTAFALEAEEILVIANQKVPESVGLATYYMERRGIPDDHLVLVDAPTTEQCSRKDYEAQIAAPVREALSRFLPAWRIRCLVTTYGVPLKIAHPETALSETEAPALTALLSELVGLGQQLKDDLPAEEKSSLDKRIRDLKNDIDIFGKYDGRAAVDSELALVKAAGYPLSGWIHNPFYPGHGYVPPMVSRSDVLMISRLDGPDVPTVRRIIDDTLYAERRGLEGIAYFDARYPFPNKQQKLNGYQYYDRSIHRAAELVRASKRMPVVLDDQAALFQPGYCPEAALYCGWYSLGEYIDAFQWQRGAIGFHIASKECVTLRNPQSRVWCKKMLDHGAAATIGPVGEPYVQAFPIPERFFLALVDGYLTLGECYLLSLPYLSWKMVLIGDPLYRPFGGGA